MPRPIPCLAEAPRPFLPFLNPIEGDHWIEPLHDGTPVLIRMLRADDREREEAFLARLSPQARRMRFLESFNQANASLVDALMDVDGHSRVAFVALIHEGGSLREIGISRYSAEDGGRRCECAVTVADEWQGQGLGVLLMRHLIDTARIHGFAQMFSIDAAENQPMRDLAGYLGFHCRLDPRDHTQVIHTLDLH